MNTQFPTPAVSAGWAESRETHNAHSTDHRPETVTVKDNFCEFPFDEIRTASGNYFSTMAQAIAAGYEEDQIWSVTECEGSYSYGPSHPYFHLLGFIATQERHDGETYYHEEAQEPLP